MPRGLLIVIEGIDGSGKTTLRNGLAGAFRARGREVVETKEPTNGPKGQRLRQIAQAGRDTVTAEEELQLFHEDRKEHVRDVIRPALERGAIVVQDRSYFSTIAYQGERGIDRNRIRVESELIAPRPDILFVCDVPIEEVQIRIAKRGKTDDFERIETLRRLRDVFRGFSEAVILDTRLPEADVLVQALQAIEARI